MTYEEWNANVDRLDRIVSDMRAGRWPPSSELLLLTRDAETGIVTFARIGAQTGVLEEAHSLYQDWEVGGAQVQ